MSADSNKEREILEIMRKVLSNVVKDATPPSRAMKHPLSDATIQDIRACFALITSREKELSGGIADRPHFVDEPRNAEVVSIDSIGRAPKKS